MPAKYRSPVMDRRSFVKIVTASLGSMMAAIVGLPVIQYFISPALGKTSGDEWISLGSVDNYPLDLPTLFNFTITKVNGWERSSMSYGAFVLRKDGQDPIVLSDVCTHLSCRVNWDEESKEFNCPCHAAFFDQDGEVVSGPPPRALDRYETRIDGDQLFIHLTEG
jgi:menaquinol-cytochrome c reductase iron-sulfur subunit